MDNFMEKLQGELLAVQTQLKERTVNATDSTGLVTVTVNGHQEVIGIRLEPSGLYPKNQGSLEQALVKAINEALQNSRDLLRQEISQLTGGMDFSNFSDLF